MTIGMADRLRYEPTDLLTVDEVAGYLKLSRRTVERYDIPWSRVSRRERRVLFSTLVEWVRDRQPHRASA